MFEKLSHLILDRELPLRERIFRMSIIVAVIMAVVGIVECFILMDIVSVFIPLVILLLALCAAVIATFKYRKFEMVSNIVAFLIIMVVFPEMFLLGGGIEGGATVWFVLGIFYVFLMYNGKRLIFFLSLAITMYATTYLFGYYCPNAIVPMANRTYVFIDSFFGVLSVGISLGIISKFQMTIFEVEKDVSDKQQEELKNISESRNSFFAGMSHEIRTPINTIIGLNEMILRENQDENTREYAANIQVAGKMLLSLVNDILDLSRMEMKKMEVIPIEYDTRELFQDLVDIIQVRALEKNLKLYVDIDSKLPASLYGDERRIKQIILNLLTNAVKYTPEGSVTLSVFGEFNEDNKVTIKVSVEDTGIGIRKENIKYLYDVFKRIDEKNNVNIEGSGLGLAISKGLLDMMNGEIFVDSIYTKGSNFTVVFPQDIVDKTPIGNESFLAHGHISNWKEYKQSFEAPEAKILVVDDNEMNSVVVQKLLSATKVHVDIALGGSKCLEKTKSQYYDVILMDYMMPVMNGAETLRLIREQENGLCKNSPVIVLTANSLAEAKQLCEDNNFDSYLEKPIQGDKLEEEILRFIPDELVEYRRDDEKIKNSEDKQVVANERKNARRRKKVCITTDCVSDITDEISEKYDIKVMYLYIRTDRGRFADTREISSDNLDQYNKNGFVTAYADSVTAEEYEQFFAEALTYAEDVIHISMTSKIGKSFGIAVEAARSFDHVHIIDSTQISCGEGLVAMYAAKLALQNYSAKEICRLTESMKSKVMSRFMLPSLQDFYKIGKIPGYINGLCNAFKLHPILEMKRGKMVLHGVGIGNLEKWWRMFIGRHIFPLAMIDTEIVYISHVNCNVRQQELLKSEVMKHASFKNLIINKASFSNACNTGLETIAISYFKK